MYKSHKKKKHTGKTLCFCDVVKISSIWYNNKVILPQ